VGTGRSLRLHTTGDAIFKQSDVADALFYVRRGRVKVTVVSSRGKQAVITILGSGDFFGEGCLAGQLFRMSSAAAMSDCLLMRLEDAVAIAAIHKEPAFSGLFLNYVLSRNIRIEEDLIDHLFNSSEKRLARVLLLLAHFGKDTKPDTVIPKMSQATLAEIAVLFDSPAQLDLEDLERRMTVLEQKLTASLTATADEEMLLTIRRELDRQLAPYRRRMTAEQLSQLERQYTQKRLFERFDLPRLSLFYLT